MIGWFNLSFAEQNSIKWLHAGDIFTTEESSVVRGGEIDTHDPAKAEREVLVWPLQSHTRSYLENMSSQRER